MWREHWIGWGQTGGTGGHREEPWFGSGALANLKLTGCSVNGDGTPEGGTPGNRVWAGIAEQEQRCKNAHHQTKTRTGFVGVQGSRTGDGGRKLRVGRLNLYRGGL